MGKFLESEKIQQIAFKASSPTISDSARSDGIFMKKPRSFCLPLEQSNQISSRISGNRLWSTSAGMPSSGTTGTMENQATTCVIQWFAV